MSIKEGEGDEFLLLRITQEDFESKYVDRSVHHVVIHCRGGIFTANFPLSLALCIRTHPPAKKYKFLIFVHVHIYRTSICTTKSISFQSYFSLYEEI